MLELEKRYSKKIYIKNFQPLSEVFNKENRRHDYFINKRKLCKTKKEESFNQLIEIRNKASECFNEFITVNQYQKHEEAIKHYNNFYNIISTLPFEEIYFDQIIINNPEAYAIKKFINRCRNLTTISYFKCDISELSFNIFFYNNFMSNFPIKYLDLRANVEIDNRKLLFINTYLKQTNFKQNSFLEVLKFNSSHIQNDFIISLLRSLEVNTNLKSLSIGFNSSLVTDEMTFNLRNIIKCTTTLQELSLTHGRFRNDGIINILEGLRFNCGIIKFSLICTLNNWNNECDNSLISLFIHNKNLINFQLVAKHINCDIFSSLLNIISQDKVISNISFSEKVSSHNLIIDEYNPMIIPNIYLLKILKHVSNNEINNKLYLNKAIHNFNLAYTNIYKYKIAFPEEEYQLTNLLDDMNKILKKEENVISGEVKGSLSNFNLLDIRKFLHLFYVESSHIQDIRDCYYYDLKANYNLKFLNYYREHFMFLSAITKSINVTVSSIGEIKFKVVSGNIIEEKVNLSIVSLQIPKEIWTYIANFLDIYSINMESNVLSK